MDGYIKELESHIASAIGKFKEDVQGIRTSRPSTQLIENVKIDYAGEQVPLKQIGSLSVKPPREIDISLWDHSLVSSVIKAVEGMDMGLTVTNEGNVVRAFLPPLSEERRQELVRIVKKTAEQIRIQLRGYRDESNKKIKTAEAEKQLNKDQAFRAKEEIQKKIDDANKKIEDMIESKLQELKE